MISLVMEDDMSHAASASVLAPKDWRSLSQPRYPFTAAGEFQCALRFPSLREPLTSAANVGIAYTSHEP